MFEQYFSCDGCDIIDDQIMSYYNCILLQDIGPYKAGARVSSISIDLAMGEIDVYESEIAEDPNWIGRIACSISELD